MLIYMFDTNTCDEALTVAQAFVLPLAMVSSGGTWS